MIKPNPSIKQDALKPASYVKRYAPRGQMNKQVFLSGLLSLVMFVGASASLSASPKCAEFNSSGECEVWSVSVKDLLDTPAKYEGKKVRVSGFIHLNQPPLYEEVSDGIYLAHAPIDAADYKKGFLLSIPVNHPQRTKFAGTTGKVEGIFRLEEKGHMGLWAGTISDVTSIKKR